MSHYLTIPINENGIICDADMNDVIAEAIAVDPFGFKDIYIYSHGWSTDATRALDEYNRFSIDLSKSIQISGRTVPQPFRHPPGPSLGVGIHWPSQISEDPNNALNKLQLLTFYTMEKRADSVGRHAVYSILRIMLEARKGTDAPLRFNLLGHSFGCKVVCAALDDIANDLAAGVFQWPDNVEFNVALLQAATDSEDLRATGGCYKGILQLPSRVLVTFSSEDRALNEWYVVAGKLANLFHTPRNALGAHGPGPQTVSNYGGSAQIMLRTDSTSAILKGINSRLIVADLSQIHKDRPSYDGGISGHHSDINLPAIYELLSGFLFGVS